MLIQKGSREDAVHALINMWLKDDLKSCVYCNRESFFELCEQCDKPLLMNNKETLQQFTTEIRKIRETAANKYASTKDKSMRFGVSIPYGLYNFLDKSMEKMYGEKLFTKEYDIKWFMRKFGKYFGIPEEV